MKNYNNKIMDEISRNELTMSDAGDLAKQGCGYIYQTSISSMLSNINELNDNILFVSVFSISHVCFVANGHYL